METFCGEMIRKMISLKLQRGWSKLIHILLMISIKEMMMGVLVVREDKKIAWKNYREKLLNTETSMG